LFFSFKKEKEILPWCSALKDSGGRGFQNFGAAEGGCGGNSAAPFSLQKIFVAKLKMEY